MHTKGKLVVYKEMRISDENGSSVATLAISPNSDEISKANARRLVACWNEHDDLVKERDELALYLTLAMDWINSVPFDTELPVMPGFDRDYVDDLLAKYPEE